MKIAQIQTTMLAMAALGAVGLLWLASKKAGDGIAAVSNAAKTTFNPASDQNFAYGAANKIGGIFSDQKDWTLGGAIYEEKEAISRDMARIRNSVGDFFGLYKSKESAPERNQMVGDNDAAMRVYDGFQGMGSAL